MRVVQDETATRAVLRGVPEQPLLVAAGKDAALDGGLAPLRLSGANAADSDEEKEDHAETTPPTEAPMPATRETYTLTVGDLCFLALGQILNRRWEPVRSSPKGLLLMGPGAVNGVAAAAAREARAITASLLWQRLKDDLDAGDGPLRVSVLERPAFLTAVTGYPVSATAGRAAVALVAARDAERGSAGRSHGSPAQDVGQAPPDHAERAADAPGP
jgi:hypothetical protein